MAERWSCTCGCLLVNHRLVETDTTRTQPCITYDCQDYVSVVERTFERDGKMLKHIEQKVAEAERQMKVESTVNVKLEPSQSAVDHPAHYGGASNPYEAIKVIEAWKADFCTGNALKYLCRAGKKGDDKEAEDVLKAIWYLKRRYLQLTGHEAS